MKARFSGANIGKNRGALQQFIPTRHALAVEHSPGETSLKGNRMPSDAFCLPNGALHGTDFGMNTTIKIGKAGRLVIPKAIRDNLGLREGTRLRLTVTGGKLEAEPEADEVRIETKDGFPVIRGGRKLREGAIAEAIQADREARVDRVSPRRTNQ